MRRRRPRRRIFGLPLRHRLHGLRPAEQTAAPAATALATATLAALATVLATRAPAAALATLATRAPAAQTGSAWLGSRGNPRSSAVPSPPGLCAGPPAGRPPDGVCTA